MEHFKSLLLGILVTLVVFGAFFLMVKQNVLPSIEGAGEVISQTAKDANVELIKKPLEEKKEGE